MSTFSHAPVPGVELLASCATALFIVVAAAASCFGVSEMAGVAARLAFGANVPYLATSRESRLEHRECAKRAALAGGSVGLVLFGVVTTLSLRRALSSRERARQTSSRGEIALHQETERHARLLEALARSDQEIDKLAYVTAHDLKAPLRSIENLASWIEEDLGPTVRPETVEYLRLLHGRVHRMESLIDGILQVARAGRPQRPPCLVDVAGLVARVVDRIDLPPSCQIAVDPGMPVLMTHRRELQQVFTNLITNAVKHARRPDPTIRIGSRDLGWAFELSVSDDGPGIAPRFHQRIFEMFTTLEPRDRAENTGVGLAVVKKIVDSVGGAVRVESQEGRGASFIVTWPKDVIGWSTAPPMSLARPAELHALRGHD